MKLLFVIGNVYPYDDANSMIIMRICRELKRIDPDIDLYLLGRGEDNGQVNLDGINIIRFTEDKEKQSSKWLREFFDNYRDASLPRKAIQLLKNPTGMVEYILNKISTKKPWIQYQYAIQEISRDINFDAIIGVSFPFHTCTAIVKSKLNVPFVYYQLDPYASHYLNNKRMIRLLEESNVCKRASMIIMTDLIYRDYKNNILKRYLRRSLVMGFPAIEQMDFKTRPRDEQIRMLYLGTMYYDIRSPLAFLKLVYIIVNEGFNIRVDFVGPIEGTPSEEVSHYLDLLKNYVYYHGRVSAKNAKEWIERSDVLINIGNSIRNQIPSKLFEYFSSGKPIINCYKIDDCPSLQYTDRYPHCINIRDNQDLDKELISHIYELLMEYIENPIQYEMIECLFPDFTIKEVVETFYEALGHLISFPDQ